MLAGLVAPGSAQTPPKKDDAFQTAAPYAILIDADSGTVLFEKSADKLNPPASMSKLMTVELVLHTIAEGKLKYEHTFGNGTKVELANHAVEGGDAPLPPEPSLPGSSSRRGRKGKVGTNLLRHPGLGPGSRFCSFHSRRDCHSLPEKAAGSRLKAGMTRRQWC